MSSTEVWRHILRDVSLEADDLLLLEPFQIGYLPGWLPERELAGGGGRVSDRLALRQAVADERPRRPRE